MIHLMIKSSPALRPFCRVWVLSPLPTHCRFTVLLTRLCPGRDLKWRERQSTVEPGVHIWKGGWDLVAKEWVTSNAWRYLSGEPCAGMGPGLTKAELLEVADSGVNCAQTSPSGNRAENVLLDRHHSPTATSTRGVQLLWCNSFRSRV